MLGLERSAAGRSSPLRKERQTAAREGERASTLININVTLCYEYSGMVIPR